MDRSTKQELERMIQVSNQITFFGGAGVSTESGIPDFRSANGLYHQNKKSVPAEVILSYEYFIQHPDRFYQYYKRNILHLQAQPNAAHFRLAKLENEGKIAGIITQNIDGLHQKAGSHNVLELHGSVYRNYCMKCSKSYSISAVLSQKNIPLCKCGGIIRPDVVLYGELLDGLVLARSVQTIKRSDLLLIGGTSLLVFPAAGLIEYFKKGKIVIINKEETPFDHQADLVIHDSISCVLKKE
jgi:NAD-dependent deacetylase